MQQLIFCIGKKLESKDRNSEEVRKVQPIYSILKHGCLLKRANLSTKRNPKKETLLEGQ